MFPLPTSRSVLKTVCPDLNEEEMSWLVSICLGLNSFWGSELFSERKPSPVQSSCIREFEREVRRLGSLSEKVGDLNWDDFFRSRGVDYRGEEVKVAKTFCWSNIAPALPAEVGRVPLAEVCS